MTAEEKRAVEELVNEAILRNDPVATTVMSLEEARSSGAVALFDEKYGENVRVVAVGDFSKELCGGTHLHESAEACQFRLVSEGGVAAGIRRIEGLTGDAAWQMARQQDQTLTDAAALLKVQTSELVHRIDGLMDRVRLLEKQAEAQQKKEIAAAAELAAGKAKVLSGLPVVMTVMTVGDAEQLRDAADRIRDRIGAGLVVLAADLQGKAAWVVMAGADATGRGLQDRKSVV